MSEQSFEQYVRVNQLERGKKYEQFQTLNLFEIENYVISIRPIVLTKLPSVSIRDQSGNTKHINISNQRI